MDLPAISKTDAINNPTQLANAIGISVLRKALDIQASSAAALIESIPAPPQIESASLPDHIGRNINVSA